LILQEIEAQLKRQYLLLHSFKEVITSLSSTSNGLDQLMASVPTIWEQMFRHYECPEEGSRNVVTECLGKLVLVNPEELLPRLQVALKSDSALTLTAVVLAVNFTISDQPQPIDSLLRQSIGQFLFALQDPEPSLRRVALVAFNSAVHNKTHHSHRDFLEQTVYLTVSSSLCNDWHSLQSTAQLLLGILIKT
jgi:cullin-associated NEDD8-dissociated protein 1